MDGWHSGGVHIYIFVFLPAGKNGRGERWMLGVLVLYYCNEIYEGIEYEYEYICPQNTNAKIGFIRVLERT